MVEPAKERCTEPHADSPAKAIALPLGERYRIERELGAGGMATVFLATDTKHGRQVAVKVLRPELSASLAADRFLREIGIAAQLLHPHILGLIDSGETDGSPFYVMPYVEGESLRAWAAREGQLPVADVTDILRQVVSALSYAHQRGIVHRDIKPGNILVSSESSALRSAHALVSDFGVAKALEQARSAGMVRAPSDERGLESRQTTLTSVGTVIGTPAYMAPEQAAADPRVDHRADLYSVGVLAYELLTGEQPFVAATPAQLLAAHLTRKPEPMTSRRSAVPPSLERLVMRCLEKQPADRFQTAAEVLRALEDSTTKTTTLPAVPLPTPVERAFLLSESECRKLDRSTLDPRIIGDTVSYLDNQRDSPVLVCFVHGTGLDQYQSEGHLRELPYRVIAPTLYGFERHRRRRIPMRLDDQITILRALISQVRHEAGASRVVIVGLSSGADIVLRMAAQPEHASLSTHGVVALGANLSLATCFATSLFANLEEADANILEGLRTMGSGLDSLDDWLNVHGYLVEAIKKFRTNVSVVRQFARDIIAPFAAASGLPAGESPFVGWYRAATERVERVRCVFEDDATINALLGEIRLAQLDAQVLGPRHRPEDIVIEPDQTHFDLFASDVVFRHLEAVLAS